MSQLSEFLLLSHSPLCPILKSLWNVWTGWPFNNHSISHVLCSVSKQKRGQQGCWISPWNWQQKKLVAKQFKQKIALKVIGPFKIDWIFRKMCVFLLPLNSGKLNWINAYIEPRKAVYLNHVKWCWFSWLLTKNSFPSLLSLNHIQFPYCTEWLRLEGSHNLTFADDLHRTKKLNCLVPKRIGAEVNPAHSKGC